MFTYIVLIHVALSISGVVFYILFLITLAFSKKVTIKGQEYELLLVDTAGQDEYTHFPTEYSVEVDGYVLVYSIDSPKSFEVCQIIHEKLVGLMGLQHK